MSMIPHSKPCLTALDFEAMQTVLASRMLAEGELVRKFEGAVSRYLGLAGGVATTSGTAALVLALQALAIGTNDEVILPTYVCRAVWDAVQATGAQPVLCDVGADWCMTAATIEPGITASTKAIIVVHTFGIAADQESIRGFGIPVIEDCCHAFGARWDSQLTGTLGDLCVLSFHATKLLTTGEGGMVLTQDAGLLEELKRLKKGDHPRVVSYQQPMTNLQAALGLSQLAQYEGFLARRQEIADFYFAKIRHSDVELPHSIRSNSIFFRFPLRITGEFDEWRVLLDEQGIQVRRGVDSLLHRQFGLDAALFPQAEDLYRTTLSIPIYPDLNGKECEWIVANLNRLSL